MTYSFDIFFSKKTPLKQTYIELRKIYVYYVIFLFLCETAQYLNHACMYTIFSISKYLPMKGNDIKTSGII